jgi:intein/homing endonuclease
MNMHMPQNVLAETELRTLAAIPYQLISPTGNSPIIGIYQDSMLGSYRFTRPNVKMSHRDAMNLLMMYNNVDMAKLKEVGDMVSSFDVLSQILPPLTLKYKTKLFEDGEDPEITNNIMEIRGGQYLRGQMEKSVLGSGTKGIIHRVCNDFGNMAASNFIDDLQNVVTEYMKSSSFSVGVSDLVADKKTAMEIIQVITDQKMEVQSVIDQVHLGTFKNNTAASNMMEFETKVNNLLNKATEQSGKIGRKSLSKNNRFLMIVNSGSKGSLINISQMISCLGQQNVDGKRIPYGFDSRTLPHFNKYDDSPNARGFIENSYIDGLTAPELFFHAMGGRIGLIDTACKSVTRDTPIVFIENNVPKYMEIGVWIDDKLNSHKDKITYQTEKNMELLNVDNVYIPTVDEDGIVTWGEVTAVTRHDPGERLYEVKTQGGRSVTVAESQSLLVWDSDKYKFLPKNSPDVSIGEYMPVTLDLNDPPNILDMPDIDIEKTVHDISNGIFNTNLICVSQKIVNAIVRVLIKRFQSENIYSEEKVSTFDKDLFSIPGFTYKRNPVVMHVKTIEAVNGVSLLCSRAGIHTIIDNQTCTISIKYEKLEESKNNVFLDPIVSINIIGVENHPKLYDLTIPSTLNFGLANGLQVRDTSSTGYIQRRLIKGLEDLKVEYDMTVRNSKGKIVQFSYGEDGFESSKVENQFINLVEMSVEDIYMHYDIVGLNDYDNDLLLIYTKGTVSRMKKQRTDSKETCKKYIDYMIKARDDIVESVFKYKNENSIKMPVSFQNIIVNIQGQLNLNANSVVDITPLEAFQLMEEYYKKLQQIYFAPPTQLFEVMYYFYLSPRDLLVNKRFHRKALVLLLETIILKYKQSIVHPGEMVGVIAGQATGEPTTQLSILRSEKIKMVRINKNTQIPEMVSGEIGALCDNIIAQLPEYTFDTGHKDSVETILEPLDDEYYIVGVDEQERTHWNKISHVSRHIVNGDMIRVTTKSGRTVETTMSHSHLVRKNQSVQPILGSDMKIGMRIPVAKHISNPFVRDSVEIAGKPYVLDHLFGWFVGAYLAEGCLTKKKGKNEVNGTISISNVSEYYIENVKKFAERFDRTCRTKSKTGKIMDSEKCYTNTDTSFTYKPLADLLMQTCVTGSFVKHVPDFAFLAPDDFKAGLLAGYFDGDGNFMCDKLHHQIRVCSRSNQLIKDISLLLSYFDIFGSLHKGYRNGANYYHLAISPKYAKRYEQRIGSNLHALKLKTLVEYSERTNAHSLREDIDKINGLGEVIASCGKKLELPGQSRLYGRWEKKEAIGRSTLEKYIELFQYHEKAEFIQSELSILRQAATSSVIWDEIVDIERYTPEQTEYVYDFTVPGNQTFMTDNAVIVHNTLNSVTFETALMVRNSKKEIQKVQIGQFTQDNIKTSTKIDYMSEKDTTYAELSEYYEVPCANELGETVWRRIEAVTQHPVINEDGTNTMLRVTTKGNREVIATKAKSFLQLIDGKIQQVHGKDLKVGDYLPVSRKPLEYTEQFEFNLREILPPSQYIYGSEIEKAKQVVNEHHWWSKHSNKTFTLPYSRSDSAYLVLSDNSKQVDRKTQIYKNGFIYTKTNSICNYTIPETIQLDYEFGYLVGAYAAEGCMTKHQVSIANNDLDYLKPIISWCDKHNLTTKIYTHTNKIQEGWMSQDVRIYSTILCRILTNLCGNLSHNKYVSPTIVFSNKECLQGFLDAYIGGDGTIMRRSHNEEYKYSGISMSSVSYQLLLDVQIMLKNLGVVGIIQKPKKIEKNNRGTLSENIHQGYQLSVVNQQCLKLAKLLNMKVEEKQRRCQELLKETFKYEYSMNDLTIPNMVDGEIIMQQRNDRCPDMMFDQIISIEEVPNTTNYAYDLTVEDTRNFDIYNGTCMADQWSATASVKSVLLASPEEKPCFPLWATQPK